MKSLNSVHQISIKDYLKSSNQKRGYYYGISKFRIFHINGYRFLDLETVTLTVHIDIAILQEINVFDSNMFLFYISLKHKMAINRIRVVFMKTQRVP